MDLGFSIIICTYNGSKRLGKTLEHIIDLKVPSGVQVELIVVDNRSSDNTREFIMDFFIKHNYNIDFILISEFRPGKAFALESALEYVRYSFVLICDDDNWIDSNYLIKSLHYFQTYSTIGILGGKSIPVFEVPPPIWLESIKSSFIIGEQTSSTGFFDQKKDYVWGAGMVFRTEIWKKLKTVNFFFSTGKCVEKAVGEDTEFSMLAKFMGYRFFYSSDLEFKHFMPESRLKWSVAINYFKGFGSTGPYFSIYKRILRKGESLSILELETEILKRTLLIFLQILKQPYCGKKNEGDISFLKFIFNIFYFKEIIRFYHFRRKCYRINSYIKRLSYGLN